MTKPTGRMPTLFLAHGAPMLLDDKAWVGQLADWARALPRPKAILMVSAHWEERPLTIGAITKVPLVYDFFGFPDRFYKLQYASPGAPELAARVRALLGAAKIPVADEPARGLDHGAYIPLMCMYPAADIPVLQISMPSLEPKALFAIGAAFEALRDEGVLIVGSGFLTHNMRSFGLPTPSWASEFDSWTREVLARGDVDSLLDYRKKGPAVQMALPTHEHFVPVVLAAGAAGSDVAKPSFPIEGFWDGSSFTKRSVQYG